MMAHCIEVKGIKANEIMEGPFTLSEFNQRKRQLSIEELEFQEEL